MRYEPSISSVPDVLLHAPAVKVSFVGIRNTNRGLVQSYFAVFCKVVNKLELTIKETLAIYSPLVVLFFNIQSQSNENLVWECYEFF